MTRKIALASVLMLAGNVTLAGAVQIPLRLSVTRPAFASRTNAVRQINVGMRPIGCACRVTYLANVRPRHTGGDDTEKAAGTKPGVELAGSGVRKRVSRNSSRD